MTKVRGKVSDAGDSMIPLCDWLKNVLNDDSFSISDQIMIEEQFNIDKPLIGGEMQDPDTGFFIALRPDGVEKGDVVETDIFINIRIKSDNIFILFACEKVSE